LTEATLLAPEITARKGRDPGEHDQVFTIIYVGISSLIWAHLGAVGSALDKEIGKVFSRWSGPVRYALASEFSVRNTDNCGPYAEGSSTY
jgi:hypothetical protein